MSETLEIFDLIDGPCYCATSDGPCPYCDSMGNARSAVEALETTNERLRAALKTSICPAGSQTVKDCIRDGCGCENGLILGSDPAPGAPHG